MNRFEEIKAGVENTGSNDPLVLQQLDDFKWLIARLEEHIEFLSGLKCGWGVECGDEQDVGCIEGGIGELLGKLEGK